MACSNKEEVKDLTVIIKLENNGEPLVGFEPFDYPGGYSMFLTKFSLFISDMNLVRKDGSTVLIADVLYVDLLDGVQTPERAEQGISVLVPNVPDDVFEELTFNIGIPSDLNAQKPADFELDNPLSNSGEYWIGWSSFIFHKTEGKIDADGDGEFETNIALHIGSDDAFRSTEYPIVLNVDDDQSLTIKIDVNHIYNTEGGFFDFSETPQIHHLGLLPKALPIMDGLSSKIIIE